MGVDAYGQEVVDGAGPYKSVAQIWKEATEQGAKYRTLSAKHRYNVVKDCSGDDFITQSELRKVKSTGHGSFATGDCRPLYEVSTPGVSLISSTSCCRTRS